MNVLVYTDGSYQDHKSGYAAIYVLSQEPIIEYGALPTKWNSNQKAELYAIYQALLTLRDARIYTCTLRTDSQYAINCLTIWVANWLKNGWKTANKKPVENRELIQLILQLLQIVKVNFEYTPGHSGEKYNELADKWAKLGTKKFNCQ